MDEEYIAPSPGSGRQSGGDEGAAAGFEITEECVGCGKCLAVCPQKCITAKRPPYRIERELCLRCGLCRQACPAKAVRRLGG